MITGVAVNPIAQQALNNAENDSIMVVKFDDANYSKDFSLSFKFKYIFAGKYRLIWRGKSVPSGEFQIYCNGKLMNINIGPGIKDRIDLYDLRNNIKSVVVGQIFQPKNGFNSFDVLLDNITEYGDVDITIKYLGPGQRSENGFVIDYITLEGIK